MLRAVATGSGLRGRRGTGYRGGVIGLAGGGALTERIVAFGGYIPDTQFNNSGGTWDRFETRSWVKLGRQPVSRIKLVYYNGWVPSGLPEANNENAITIEAALESVSPSAVVMCTWGGAATVTASPGEIVETDWIDAADFSLSEFSAAKIFFARTGVTGFGTGRVPQSSQVYTAVSGENQKASLGGSSQINATGAMAGANNVKGLIPLCIIGEWADEPDVSVLILGDSIITGPSTGKFNGTTGGGFVTAGLASVNGGIVPQAKASRSGGKASEFHAGNSNPAREYMMARATHLIENYGVNDMRASVAYATVLADKETLWEQFREQSPIGYIVSTPVVPNTTSTDSWATLANQTVFNALFDVGADRDDLNAAVVSALGTDINETIDTNLIWQDQTATQKWIVDGSANYATSDGLHPAVAQHTAAAVPVADAAQYWTPTGRATVLDAPVSAATDANTYMAFGFDKLVHDYTGDTVRLKRLSDNAESDFGFVPGGIFDMEAVDAWRSTANVDVVNFYDQMGGTGELTADGTVAFIRSNVVKRFGCAWSATDENLTRSLTEGAVGCDLAATGALHLTGTYSIGLAADGLEWQMLYNMNTRKVQVPGSDPFGGNNAQEHLTDIGTGSDNHLLHMFFDTFPMFTLVATPGGENDNAIVGAPTIFKPNAQHILHGTLTSSAYAINNNYQNGVTKSWSATNSANIAAGGMDDCKFAVGAAFSDGAGNLSAGNRGNFLFGGLILTKTLTASERFSIISRLGAVGQQHRIKQPHEISAYFDEIIYLKDADAGTGFAAGSKGQTTLEFNIGTVTEGTSDIDMDYDEPITGLNCVWNPDADNEANGFEASNNYFADVRTGTILGFTLLDNTGNRIGNAVVNAIAVKTGNPYAGEPGNRSLSLGVDHSTPSLWTTVCTNIDVDGITGTRKVYPSAQAGDPFDDREYVETGDDAGSEAANQANGKYNRNTMHGNFVYAKTFSKNFPIAGTINQTWTEARWANEDATADMYCDAPTGTHVPQNTAFETRYSPLCHIATFQEPAGYVHGGGYTANRDVLLNAINKSYLALPGGMSGQRVGDIAINNHAALSMNEGTAKLMSDQFQKGWQGAYFMFGFANSVLTQQQVEEVQVNLYKLLEA